MDFNVLSTQNWSRMFNVWIEDIQVIGLPAAIAPFEIHRSILPKVRVFVPVPVYVVDVATVVMTLRT